MKKNKTFIGLVILGALFTSVGCEYYDGKNLATIAATDDTATQKKLDEMTTKIEELEKELAAGAEVSEDGIKDYAKTLADLTIADFAGTWKATKYVIDDCYGKTCDLIALKEYEAVELSVAEDGSSVLSIKPKGKDKVSFASKLILENEKLSFKGLDKSAEEPFEFVLEGDSMNWTQPTLEDSILQISWERVSKDVVVPKYLTLEDIAGKWDMTSYVVSDPKSGLSVDYVQAGYKTQIVIDEVDATLDFVSTYQGTTNNYKTPLVMKGDHLTFDQMNLKIALEGDTMQWSGETEIQGVVCSLKIELKEAGL